MERSESGEALIAQRRRKRGTGDFVYGVFLNIGIGPCPKMAGVSTISEALIRLRWGFVLPS